VRAAIDAIQTIKNDLAYLQLGWRPPTGGWSIAQVFEHLCISDASYLDKLHELATHGKRGDTPWRPTLAGRLLINLLRPTSERKVPAPRIYRPAAQPRAHVVEEYLKMREVTLAIIDRARSADLVRNRLSSPVFSLIRMNLGDAIMVLVVHTQRHLQQIARVRTHPEFPKG
jgi:hypothetical protein